MKKKKQYAQPEIEKIVLLAGDLISTSGNQDDFYGGSNPWDV